MTNHYEYLERVLPEFFKALGLASHYYDGILVAHHSLLNAAKPKMGG